MGKITSSFYLIHWNITNFKTKMVELQSQAKEKDRNVPIKLWRRQRQINKRVKQSRWVNRINFIISALKKVDFVWMLKSNDKQKSILGQHCLFCASVWYWGRGRVAPPSGTRCLAHCTNITALSLHLQFDNRSQKYSQHLYRIFRAGRRKDFLAVHCTSHLGIPVYRVSFTSLRILRFFSSSVEDAV